MTTQKVILKKCNKAYDKSGVQGAIDMAEKLGVKSYALCKPCEAEQPSANGVCCVCGNNN